MEQERYRCNTQTFSWEELELIRQKKVCIVGCGGLGGHVCQTLARFGVGALTLIDGDVFTESNLNRQVFSTTKTLKQNKANATKAALIDINPDVAVTAHPVMLSETNVCDLLRNHDLVVDCLDNIKTRFMVADACSDLNIPLIHGAIAGFYGHVANIFPGDGLLKLIYPDVNNSAKGLETALGNPPFTPQLVAALQCSEALKLLAGSRNVLRNAMLHIDMLENSYDLIELII